jgi:putative molybdopterin biosynthesis protein
MADPFSHAKVQPVADGRQTQFLTVITRDEATERFRRHLKLEPLGHETVPLADALNRVLGDDVIAEVDVPGFDRSNVDGFGASGDNFGAGEVAPRDAEHRVLARHGARAVHPRRPVIATGRCCPGRGCGGDGRRTDVVVDPEGTRAVEIGRAVTAGEKSATPEPTLRGRSCRAPDRS